MRLTLSLKKVLVFEHVWYCKRVSNAIVLNKILSWNFLHFGFLFVSSKSEVWVQSNHSINKIVKLFLSIVFFNTNLQYKQGCRSSTIQSDAPKRNDIIRFSCTQVVIIVFVVVFRFHGYHEIPAKAYYHCFVQSGHWRLQQQQQYHWRTAKKRRSQTTEECFQTGNFLFYLIVENS